MEESPSTKDMRPVAGLVMHNFLYWLMMRHPEIKSLQSLPQGILLQLAQQFESCRPEIESSTLREWLKGFEQLFKEITSHDSYEDARVTLKRAK